MNQFTITQRLDAHESIAMQTELKELRKLKQAMLSALLDDIDGETMEAYIRQAGMEEQMLRQLIMTMPDSMIQQIVDEKNYLKSITSFTL